MDSPDSTLYIQKIEELVYDNGDIITPTILSPQLNIKVSDARLLMERYVKETQQCKVDDLAVTYILIGTNHDGNLSIGVVKETDLQERKDQLRSVISEQIYSVQKSKDVELNSLAILESIGTINIQDTPLLGSIVSSNAIKRKLKTIPIQTPTIIKKEDNQKATSNFDNQPNSSKQNQKNGGISRFLSKDTSKLPSKPTIQAKPKPKSLMANFLNKPPNKTSNNNKTDEFSKKENGVKVESVPELYIKNGESVEEKKAVVEEKPKHKLIDSDSDENIPTPKKAKRTPKQKQKKKRHNKDKSDQVLKRRRIIQNDSDSEDIFESDNDRDMEDEDIITSDQEAPPPKQLFPTKRKIRKAVTEMIQDDDGYFQTVNKFVYESASGEEDEAQNDENNDKNGKINAEENKEQKSNNVIEPKKQDNNSKLKNVSPPKAVKNGKRKTQKPAQNQASIMNFLKKK